MSYKNGLEIERKFVIEYPDARELARLRESDGAACAHLTQIYLAAPDGVSARIRRIERENGTEYRKTVKRGSGLVRAELEEEITAEEFDRLSLEADGALSPICKTRLCVPSGARTLEIDLYDGFTDYAICEVELDSPDEALPDMRAVRVIKEVTDDVRFSNYAMARDGMPQK